MGTIAIICIAVVIVAIVVTLAILVYHQMLLINEVNKRLLLLAKDSIDDQRSTQEELQNALIELQNRADEEQPQVENNNPYRDPDLD